MSANAIDGRILVSYLTLRRVVGVLGVLLPVLVAVGCFLVGSCTELLDSISDYYGSMMRDIFVGVLFAIAWFLFSYRGYEAKDNTAGDLACVFALGVALFPTTSNSGAIRAIHFLSAAALFLVLAYFSLCLFTKTAKDTPPTREKRIRNRIYRVSGVIMLACILGVGVYYVLLRNSALSSLKPVFWLETAALWAFGLSWFVKGETLWRDRETESI
jgi:hypothetical protein